MIRHSFRYLAAILLLTFPIAAWAFQGQDALAESLVAMRRLDERVASIGHRLSVANRELCADRQWLPGFTIHHLSQYGGDYREAASRVFGLAGEPAILAVAAESPAQLAGLQRDDGLLRVDGDVLPRPASRDFDDMEPLLDALDRAFADGAAILEVRRGGERLSLSVPAEQGCRTRYQVAPSRNHNSWADGLYVKITTALAHYAADDQELAAILAHELAHNLLGHRARLDAAGVARGLLGNFGRHARLIRETEVEADRISVYLLDRAGYDAEAPVRFWSRFGRRGLNFLNSATHPGWRRRIALFQAEIESIRRARAAGTAPVPPFAAPAP